MKLYSVNDAYIAHLKKTDARVSDNYGGDKPYVGPLFELNGMKWYGPLTSEKPNFAKEKAFVYVFSLHEVGKPSNALGRIDFRNLIPIPDDQLTPYVFTRLDERYRLMLDAQYQFIKHESERLAKKASQFFDLAYNNKSDAVVKMACDFRALEKAVGLYKPTP